MSGVVGAFFLDNGIFAFYAFLLFTIGSSYKLWAYKTTRDVVLTDLQRVRFVWSKIQDVYTARTLAGTAAKPYSRTGESRHLNYYLVEEKLWWQLHRIFRDQANFFRLTSQPNTVGVSIGLQDQFLSSSGIQFVSLELPFISSISYLRERACRRLGKARGSGARYELHRCDASGNLRQSDGLRQGDATLWNAGILQNEYFCLVETTEELAQDGSTCT